MHINIFSQAKCLKIPGSILHVLVVQTFQFKRKDEVSDHFVFNIDSDDVSEIDCF